MPTETVEPQIDNPVIKPDFLESAKSAFNKQRAELGLDAPAKPEPKPEPKADLPSTPEKPDAKPETDVDIPTASPSSASVLPDDVLAPKKEEPKESDTIAAIEAMELPKGAKEKTVADFNKLKTRSIESLKAAENRVKELESKLSASTSNSEIESLQSKLKAAEEHATKIEEEWAKIAFETSPRFQSKFVKAEQAAIEDAKTYLEGTEIKPGIIEYAARNTGRRRLEILQEAGATPEMIAAIGSHLSIYDAIQRDKQSAIENWKGESAQWMEADQQRAQAEEARRVENENRIWESVLSRNEILPFRSSKDETWNSRANELKAKAKDIFNGQGADLEIMAATIQKGVAYDALSDVVQRLRDENKRLNDENSQLKSSAPGGGMTTTNGALPGKDQSKMTQDERARSTFNEQLGLVKGR